MKIAVGIVLCVLFIPYYALCQNSLKKEHEFVALFPEIKFSSFHVFPLSDKKGGKKFQGVEISRKFYKYFHQNSLKNIGTLSKFFACNRFILDKTHLGLIARTPSQYENSSIELFAWNIIKQKIDYTIILADTFGDGAWYFSKNAWIFDYQNNNSLDLVIRRKDWSEDEKGKEHQTDSTYIILNDGNIMKKCKNCKIEPKNYIIFDF